MKKELMFIVGMIGASVFTSVSAEAEVITGTSLSVNFESAHIVGSGRNINMNRVPVINVDTGETTFYDASFKFTFTPGAGFLFEQISSVGISPPLSSTNLIPGIYNGDNSSAQYELSEPSILPDGRLLYTLSRHISVGFSAQIVTGNVTNHPDIGAREIATSLSSSYTYGIITSEGISFQLTNENDTWLENHLVGVRQAGNTLSITLFSQGVDSNNNPQDFSSQKAGAILTLDN